MDIELFQVGVPAFICNALTLHRQNNKKWDAAVAA
jgi:hypothetical protein